VLTTDIGRLILSPTRTYFPVLKEIFAHHREAIKGLIHCTGGAQTKVMKFVNGVRVIKDQLFEIPTLFRLIEAESGTPRKEMYEVFNMGHRMELYCDPGVATELVDISLSHGINAQIIGRVEDCRDGKELIIEDTKGTYTYI